MGSSRSNEPGTSVLESLRQANRDMEELLASIEQQTRENHLLNKLLMNDMEASTQAAMIVQCPNNVMACTLNLRSKTKDNPAAVTLNPVILKVSRKRKEMQEETPNLSMMNFVIWNARGANSVAFRRHYEALVKTHNPAMLVLLETKMTEHKHITEALKFDVFIQTLLKASPMASW